MTDLLAQARQEIARHGHVAQATSLSLIDEVERLRAEAGETPAVIPWRLEQVSVEPASALDVATGPYELRIGVDALTDERFLHDLLMESPHWRKRFSGEDKQRLILAALGVPNGDVFPFAELGEGKVPDGYQVEQQQDGKWIAKQQAIGRTIYVGLTQQQAAAFCWLDQDMEPPVAATLVYRLTLDSARPASPCGS